MTLGELKRALAQGKNIDVELHGLEQMIYVAFVRRGETLTPITDNRRRPMRFPSHYRAQLVLSKTGLRELEFVHTMVFGEMVGAVEPTGRSEMRQSVNIERFKSE